MSSITRQQALELDRQGLFNIVWKRAKDKVKAQDSPNGFCMYRAPDGKECFIGAAIPNELIDPSGEITFENGRKHNVNKTSLINILGVCLPNIDHAFADDLQRVHDTNHPNVWKDRLEDFAKKYGLTIPSED
jgi:hypothetical protein